MYSHPKLANALPLLFQKTKVLRNSHTINNGDLLLVLSAPRVCATIEIQNYTFDENIATFP
jgi:hypothetical protein